MPLQLTIACGDYDRTHALIDGSIKPEGIEHKTIAMPVMATLDGQDHVVPEVETTLLRFAAAQARAGGATVETALLQRQGQRASRVIVDDAARWGADVIVIGSHGRQGTEELLIGSVAEGVTRVAGVPVLLVRAR